LDRERSATTGPCNCGFRHWFEGKEYDFVVSVSTNTGPKKLAYNESDNPYSVAQEFLAKYNINPNSLNDTPYISAIANAIIDHINENKKTGTVDTPSEEPKEEEMNPSFDPYEATWNVPKSGTHYNKTTQKWETTIYEEQKKN